MTNVPPSNSKFYFNFLYHVFRLFTRTSKGKFGEPSEGDFALKVYEKDTTAAAVVLYEQGYYYFSDVDGKIKLIKEIHRKVKIFDSKQSEYGNLDIPLFVSDGISEKVKRYNEWTYNGKIKTKVTSAAVFITSIPEIGRVCRIVFPNVKDGSIIEYVYRIESPFLFNFDGWEFHGEIPKIYSEFIFKIPLDFQFNNVLYGNQSLYINNSQVIKDCLQTTYNVQIISCTITLYAMKDVPAFQEEEYMLLPRNYISRVEFEPRELRTASGWSKAKIFSNEWKDVDKFLKRGDIGGQLSKTGYFERNLPDSILSKTDKLEKAKAVYGFIQNHYTWDGSY